MELDRLTPVFSFMLFLCWLVDWYKQQYRKDNALFEIPIYLGAFIFTLASFLFFFLVPLPKAYYPEYFFHRPQEFIAAMFFLFALAGYLHKGQWRHDRFEYWLVLSLIVNLATQVFFMPLSVKLFDIHFDLAHSFKFLSYLLVLIGFFFNIRETFLLNMEEKMRLQAILSTAVDGIVSINAKGTVETFNSGAENIFGYSADEVIGNNINMLMPEPYHSAHHGYLANFIATRKAKIIGTGREVKGQRKDGSIFPMELSVGEMIVKSKQMFTGIVRDISERKQSEQTEKHYAERLALATQRYADRLALATQCGGIGVWEYDINESSLTWDDQMFRLYNVRREDFTGAYEAWSSAIHPDDLMAAENLLNDAIAGTRDFDTEFRIFWPNGTIRHIRGIGTMTKNIAGSNQCMIGVNWDITESKNIMLELEQARFDADAANLAKSAFLATMSHEIRTPMNGVLGMAEILAHSALTEQQSELTQIILQSSTTLLSLIDDILDFSKIEAGKMDISSESHGLAELIEPLCNTLSMVAAKKNVKLDLFVSPKIPNEIFCDSTRLHQILYNLIGNAIKFCSDREDQQGEILVRLELENKTPLSISFTVVDNGIGMTEETLNNLYTPFTQAEVSTTRRFGGTGLGLVICKRLVELMQGELSVVSTPDVGSTFTVTMPFEAPTASSEPDLADVHGLNCIVINSADYITEDIKAYLDYAGVKTNTAVDSLTASEVAAKINNLVVVIHGSDWQISSDSKTVNEFSTIRHVMITRGGAPIRNLALGNYICITNNPLRRKSLLQAVAVASGRLSPNSEDNSSENIFSHPTVAALSPEEAQAQGRLILVAEDDDVNQKVIRQQFELLGYTGDFVNNGEQALQHWRTGQYSLLLTDLHMPKMDGYELSKLIRTEENMGKRIPILALTANALRGEEYRAKAVGVDEYLTKPISLAALDAALKKWLPPLQFDNSRKSALNAKEKNAKAISKVRKESDVLDLRVLTSLVGNNDNTIAEFLNEYLTSAIGLSKQICDAHEVADYSQVAAIAHRLKSSSRSVGAIFFGELCSELERAGETKDLAALEKVLAKFSKALSEVRQAIDNELAKQSTKMEIVK